MGEEKADQLRMFKANPQLMDQVRQLNQSSQNLQGLDLGTELRLIQYGKNIK